MRAELQIQSLYDHYPNLFQTRDEVLRFIFCVMGNGFMWSDGELIEKIDPLEPVNKLRRKKAHQYKESEKGYHRALCRDIERKDHWQHYDLAGSFLCNYPENITKDWLKLLEECREMIIEDGIEIPVATEADISFYGKIFGEGGGPGYAPGG